MQIVIHVVLALAVVLLVLAAGVAIERVATGPSQLDRSIAADLLVATVIGATGCWALFSGQDTEIAVVLILSLVGFTGAVGIARMVSERIVRARSDEQRTSPRPGKEERR